MSIKTDTVRDEQGSIVRAVASKGSHRLEMLFDKQVGYTIKGSLRSLNDAALMNALKLIFPTQDRTVLSIPEPLAVSVVQGGKIALFDDIEGLLKWNVTDGTVAADNTFAFNGSQSLKMTCGAANTQAIVRRWFPMPASRRVEVSAVICVQLRAKLNGFYMTVTHRNGVDRRAASLVYAVSSQLWGNGVVGYEQKLPNIEQYDDVGGAWHKVGFVADLAASKMEKFFVDNNVFTGPYKIAAPVADANPTGAYIDFTVDNAAGQEAIVWADDVKVQEYP